jgi:hypothetical protein
VTRVLAAVSLGAGVILPMLGSTEPMRLFGVVRFSSPAQAAVACLAFGGLLIGADQVFMISVTWSRYISAMMKIETLMKVTEYDWTALKSNLKEPIPAAAAAQAQALFRALVTDSRSVVETETAAWSSDITKAIEQLRGLVDQQKVSAAALAKEEQNAREAARKLAAAARTGTVRAKIGGDVQRLRGTVRITVGAMAEEREAPVSTVVLMDVPEGPHQVTLAASGADGKPITDENAVQVTPESVADVQLTVPTA